MGWVGCLDSNPPGPAKSPEEVDRALTEAAKEVITTPPPEVKDKPPAASPAAPPKEAPPSREKAREHVVSEEIRGTLLQLLPGNKVKNVPDATVTLACDGEKPKEDDGRPQACESEVIIKQQQAGKDVEIARLQDDVPGIAPESKVDADYSLKLDILELPDLGGSLLVVRYTRKDKEVDPQHIVEEHLYMLQDRELVQVLEYNSLDAQYESEGDDSPTKNVEIKTTLAVQKHRTNGLSDLLATILTETVITRRGRDGRPTIKKKTVRYVWDGQKYDACDVPNTPSHCGRCGHACRPGEGCCHKECQKLDVPQRCGACENVCPGLGKPAALALCESDSGGKPRCAFRCQGGHYDVDGKPETGCEAAPSQPGHYRLAEAVDLGTHGCGDGAGGEWVGDLLSDERLHQDPPLPSFSGRLGAAPLWARANANGGLCLNDLAVTVTTQGGDGTPCYRLSILTDRSAHTLPISGRGTANLSAGRGAYTTGKPIYFLWEKTCSAATRQAVRFTVRYHF